MSTTKGLFAEDLRTSTILARVAPDRGIDRGKGLLYAVPSEMSSLRQGDRVRVPLGRGDKLALGWVVEIVASGAQADALAADGLDRSRIKWIESQPDEFRSQSIPDVLVELARWISQYYCCPLGMTLDAMIPAAVKKGTGQVRRIKLQFAGLEEKVIVEKSSKLTPGAKRAWESLGHLDAVTFPIDSRELAHRLGLKSAASINRLVRVGLLEEVGVTEVRARGREIAEGNPSATQDRLTLTAAQTAAVSSIKKGLGNFGGYLLFGVTGSGKTEVYLRVLEEVVHRGESAIVLVPEISLTPQTVSRFHERMTPMGIEVAVLHSGLTGAQRHREWMRVRRGEAQVVVGARSAIFAPFDAEAGSKVGLIIVDEEHDGSYKQDQLPRYQARDVALRRGQIEGCPVVLGSATPSLESWHNALPADQGGSGRFTLLELPDRVGGGSLPRVEIVDLAQEQRDRPDSRDRLHALGPKLENALAQTLEAPRGGGQVILLLNRRGYASYICCADSTCGWFMTCRDCDVTVVFHRSRETSRGYVRCHHCQAEQKLPEKCPMCQKRVNTFGFGTQRLEEELERKFPQLRSGETLLRIDADTMRHVHDYHDALSRFGRGEVRVLMGTQMIAKGLDFPNVELIGVINADTGLYLPDFRASERTFQLVAQVAGRAGRSEASGAVARVFVQTMNPSEPAITLAAKHDFVSFAQYELTCRRSVGLPPVGRMARIVCRDMNMEKAEARAGQIARAARDLSTPEVRIKGPMACALSRVAQHHRFGVELLAPSAGPIQQLLTTLRAQGLVKSDAKTAVDVDPVALL